MADIGNPQKTGTPAEIAIEYLLRRISNNPHLAYFFAYTESLAQLTKAHARANGQDPEVFHDQYQAALRCEDPALSDRSANEADARAAAQTMAQVTKLTVQRGALLEALKSAIAIADEAAREWDKAAGPPAPRAGKILLALCGHLRGYRMDIDEIHATIAKAEAEA
jgi:hypothetical protein